MAWVEQTGAQSWRVRYADGEGRIRSVSGFVSQEQARGYTAETAAHRGRGVWVDPSDGRVTLEVWTRSWLPTLTVSERTKENYRRDQTAARADALGRPSPQRDHGSGGQRVGG